ncbi:hypothetical protein [uncultured Polaribacter sp.]|uniref:hypothetical protein n=1 Tax=uncultured Polaribacter sp. TaxID=174711 RepID=UPI002612C978|nr:hypothetical protein [uncultured Polaribacter sp.]
MRIYLLLFALLFMFSCASRNIKYTRDKVLEKTYKDYHVFLNNQKVPFFPLLFLDKENIKNTRINKRDKTVKIEQLKKVELLNFKDLNLDSLAVLPLKWKELNLIIIDNFLMHADFKEKIKIEPSAIKNIKYITHDKMHTLNLCGHYHGNVLKVEIK